MTHTVLDNKLWDFVVTFLIPDEKVTEHVNTTIHKISNVLNSSEQFKQGVDRIFAAGGSYAKSTSIPIPNHFDVDIVAFMNGNGKDPPFQKILKDLQDALEFTKGMNVTDVFRTGHSLQFKLDGLEFDLLPAKNYIEGQELDSDEQIETQHSMALADIETKYAKTQKYDTTLSSALAESRVEFRNEQSLFICNLIRLCKFWVKTLQLDYISGKHFMIEVIATQVGQKTENIGPKPSITSAFLEFLDLIVHFESIDINFKPDGRTPPCQRPIIMDPTNPYNNVASGMDSKMIQKLKEYAKETRRRLQQLIDRRLLAEAEVQLDLELLFDPQPKVGDTQSATSIDITTNTKQELKLNSNPMIEFLITIGLQDYIKAFLDEEMDMQILLGMSEQALSELIPEIGYWSKLCTARKRYLQEKSNLDTTNPIIPYADIREFFLANEIQVDQYLPLFQKEGIEIEELINLPDDMLKKVVSKRGPWTKICMAKQALISHMSSSSMKMNIVGDNERSGRGKVDGDQLEKFLRELKLDHKYLQIFRDQELEFEDILLLSEEQLMQVIKKIGPVNRILKGRRKFIATQEMMDPNVTRNYFVGDEEYEMECDNIEAVLSDEENANIGDGKTFNILLLGETGVGKSTFVNAFANYLTFENLDMALKPGSVLHSLISTTFSVTDENFKRRSVSITGNSNAGQENESKESAQSATQSCHGYCFPFPGGSIRLIDTPGIGDTRGIKYDKINMENILGFIGQYKDLHGICILMKPNTARLTASFTFCIKELLCHLQKDAAKNIMFVFTNSRSTFYKPGDTATTLEEVLQEVEATPPYVKIPFVHENVYCYDNESFRFLLAVRSGISFKETQFNAFSESWNI